MPSNRNPMEVLRKFFKLPLKDRDWKPLALGAGLVLTVAGLVVVVANRRKRKALQDDSSNYEVVFVLGGPGSGKGTQCALLVKQFGLVHLSAGDLLREERTKGSDLGEMINTYIKEGRIVPAEVTVRLLHTAMKASGKRKFLIDGFPRNLENLQVWVQKMSSLVNVRATLFLDTPEEVMLGRLLERGKTSGRVDDNVESITKRFSTYNESTMPIIDSFRNQNKLHHVLADRSIDEVYGDVKKLFEYHIVFVLGGPGCGKGTNCQRIVQDFGFVHLSAGDLLREEKSRGTETANLINEYILEGKIVPAEITVRLLKNAMEASVKRKFLIDGFPRNIENLDVWVQKMSDCSDVQFVLFLDCPESVMEARLLDRGKTSGRSDDNIEAIKKRFKTYQKDTLPIIQSFEAKSKVRHVVSDRSQEEVYQDVYRVMKDLEMELKKRL